MPYIPNQTGSVVSTNRISDVEITQKKIRKELLDDVTLAIEQGKRFFLVIYVPTYLCLTD